MFHSIGHQLLHVRLHGLSMEVNEVNKCYNFGIYSYALKLTGSVSSYLT